MGQSEFEAEGPQSVVEQQFSAFLAIAQDAPAVVEKGVKEEEAEEVEHVERQWSRVFRNDAQGRLSLHVLPETKALRGDTLLLLLYAFQKLRGQESVRSMELTAAARQSGVRIDRVDRNLTPAHRRLVSKGGSGKGSRYSLNNRGLNYCQRLLEQMTE